MDSAYKTKLHQALSLANEANLTIMTMVFRLDGHLLVRYASNSVKPMLIYGYVSFPMICSGIRNVWRLKRTCSMDKTRGPNVQLWYCPVVQLAYLKL